MTAKVRPDSFKEIIVSGSRIQLSIESRLDQVLFLRTAVRAIAAELGFDESTCLEIQLGVTEAVNNVIEHAYNCSPDRRVAVDLETGSDLLEVWITDDGLPFPIDSLQKCLGDDPLSPESGVEELSDRGRGLWIIRQTMDSVMFDRKDGKNQLHLSKKLPAGLCHSAG